MNNGMRERTNKMTDIIANIAFNVGKGLNSKELNEINSQLVLFIQQEIDQAIAEERKQFIQEQIVRLEGEKRLKKTVEEVMKLSHDEVKYNIGYNQAIENEIAHYKALLTNIK